MCILKTGYSSGIAYMHKSTVGGFIILSYVYLSYISRGTSCLSLRTTNSPEPTVAASTHAMVAQGGGNFIHAQFRAIGSTAAGRTLGSTRVHGVLLASLA